MAKTMLLSALSKVFGEYVTGLTKENLKVAVFSGHVEFRDLALNPQAVARHQLPLEILAGSMALLKLTVPWASLETKPVRVEIQGVYLLVRPTNRDRVDPVQLHENMVLLRRLQIEDAVRTRLEAARLAEDVDDDNYVARVQNAILENMEIRITDVHIRYEDSTCLSMFPSRRPDGWRPALAVGVTIKDILVQRVDEGWAPLMYAQAKSKVLKTASVSEYVLRKRGVVQAVAAYFDVDADLLSDLGPEDIKRGMQAMIAEGGDLGPPRSRTPRGRSGQARRRSYGEISRHRLSPSQSSHLSSWSGEDLERVAGSRDSDGVPEKGLLPASEAVLQHAADPAHAEASQAPSFAAVASITGPPTSEAYFLEPSTIIACYTHTLETRPRPRPASPRQSQKGAEAELIAAEHLVDVNLSELAVRISGAQFEGLAALQAQMERLQTFYVNFAYRPKLRPDRDPRGWWKYALYCVLGARPGATTFVMQTRKEYVSLYLRTLGLSFVPELDAPDEDRLALLELQLPLHAVVYFRLLTLREKETLEQLLAARDDTASHGSVATEKEDAEDELLSRIDPLARSSKPGAPPPGGRNLFHLTLALSFSATLVDYHEQKLAYLTTSASGSCTLTSRKEVHTVVRVRDLALLDLVSSDALLGTLVRSAPRRAGNGDDVAALEVVGSCTVGPEAIEDVTIETTVHDLDVVVNYPCLVALLESFQFRAVVLSEVTKVVRVGVRRAKGAADRSLANAQPVGAALIQNVTGQSDSGLVLRLRVHGPRLVLPVSGESASGFCFLQLDEFAGKATMALGGNGTVATVARLRGFQLALPSQGEAREALARPADTVLRSTAMLHLLSANIGIELGLACRIGVVADFLDLRLCPTDLRRLRDAVDSLLALAGEADEAGREDGTVAAAPDVALELPSALSASASTTPFDATTPPLSSVPPGARPGSPLRGAASFEKDGRPLSALRNYSVQRTSEWIASTSPDSSPTLRAKAPFASTPRFLLSPPGRRGSGLVPAAISREEVLAPDPSLELFRLVVLCSHAHVKVAQRLLHPAGPNRDVAGLPPAEAGRAKGAGTQYRDLIHIRGDSIGIDVPLQADAMSFTMAVHSWVTEDVGLGRWSAEKPRTPGTPQHREAMVPPLMRSARGQPVFDGIPIASKMLEEDLSPAPLDRRQSFRESSRSVDATSHGTDGPMATLSLPSSVSPRPADAPNAGRATRKTGGAVRPAWLPWRKAEAPAGPRRLSLDLPDRPGRGMRPRELWNCGLHVDALAPVVAALRDAAMLEFAVAVAFAVEANAAISYEVDASLGAIIVEVCADQLHGLRPVLVGFLEVFADYLAEWGCLDAPVANEPEGRQRLGVRVAGLDLRLRNSPDDASGPLLPTSRGPLADPVRVDILFRNVEYAQKLASPSKKLHFAVGDLQYIDPRLSRQGAFPHLLFFPARSVEAKCFVLDAAQLPDGSARVEMALRPFQSCLCLPLLNEYVGLAIDLQEAVDWVLALERLFRPAFATGDEAQAFPVEDTVRASPVPKGPPAPEQGEAAAGGAQQVSAVVSGLELVLVDGVDPFASSALQIRVQLSCSARSGGEEKRVAFGLEDLSLRSCRGLENLGDDAIATQLMEPFSLNAHLGIRVVRSRVATVTTSVAAQALDVRLGYQDVLLLADAGSSVALQLQRVRREQHARVRSAFLDPSRGLSGFADELLTERDAFDNTSLSSAATAVEPGSARDFSKAMSLDLGEADVSVAMDCPKVSLLLVNDLHAAAFPVFRYYLDQLSGESAPPGVFDGALLLRARAFAEFWDLRRSAWEAMLEPFGTLWRVGLNFSGDTPSLAPGLDLGLSLSLNIEVQEAIRVRVSNTQLRIAGDLYALVLRQIHSRESRSAVRPPSATRRHALRLQNTTGVVVSVRLRRKRDGVGVLVQELGAEGDAAARDVLLEQLALAEPGHAGASRPEASLSSFMTHATHLLRRCDATVALQSPSSGLLNPANGAPGTGVADAMVFGGLDFEKEGATVARRHGHGHDLGAPWSAIRHIYEEEALENQRYNPMRRAWQRPFLPKDAPAWTTPDFEAAPSPEAAAPLPPGVVALEAWRVSAPVGAQSRTNDAQGWSYAGDFHSLRRPGASRRGGRESNVVRQRRWSRLCLYSGDVASQGVPHLIWEVTRSAGGECKATVRSPAVVTNRCRVALELAMEFLGPADAELPPTRIRVAPGERLALSSAAAFLGGLRFRPATEDDAFGWTPLVAALPSPTPWERSHRMEAAPSAPTASQAPGVGGFSMLVTASGGDGEVNVSVGPVAVVTNLLPCPLLCRSFLCGAPVRGVLVKLGPAESLDVHHPETFSLAVTLQNFQESSAIQVGNLVGRDVRDHFLAYDDDDAASATDAADAPSRKASMEHDYAVFELLPLQGAFHAPLRLRWRAARAPPPLPVTDRCIRVEIWASHWVFNATHLPLVIGQNAAKQAAADVASICDPLVENTTALEGFTSSLQAWGRGPLAHLSTAQLVSGVVHAASDAQVQASDMLQDCSMAGSGVALVTMEEEQSKPGKTTVPVHVGLAASPPDSGIVWGVAWDASTLGPSPVVIAQVAPTGANGGGEYIADLVAHVSNAPGVFGRCGTRILGVSPRCAVVNCSDLPLDLAQGPGRDADGIDSRGVQTVHPFSQAGLPLVAPKGPRKEKGIAAYFRMENTAWSQAPVPLSRFGSFAVHLPRAAPAPDKVPFHPDEDLEEAWMADRARPPRARPLRRLSTSMHLPAGGGAREAVLHVEVTTPGRGIGPGLGTRLRSLGHVETLVVVWCSARPSPLAGHRLPTPPPPPLYTIVNHTAAMVTFRQRSGFAGVEYPLWTLPAGAGRVWGWAAPDGSNVVEAATADGAFTALPSFGIVGRERGLCLAGQRSGHSMELSVRACVLMQQSSQVLHLWPVDQAGPRVIGRRVAGLLPFRRLMKGRRHKQLLQSRLARRAEAGLATAVTIGDASGTIAKSHDKRRGDSEISLKVPGISISFVSTVEILAQSEASRSRRRREFLRLQVRQIWVRSSARDRAFEARVGDVQLDNYMAGAVYPVALGRGRGLPSFDAVKQREQKRRKKGRATRSSGRDASPKGAVEAAEEPEADATGELEQAALLQLETFYSRSADEGMDTSDDEGSAPAGGEEATGAAAQRGQGGRVFSLRVLPLEVQLDYVSLVRMVEVVEPLASAFNLGETKAVHAPQAWVRDLLEATHELHACPEAAGLEPHVVLAAAQQPRIYFLSIWMHPVQLHLSFIKPSFDEAASVSDTDTPEAVIGVSAKDFRTRRAALSGAARSALDLALSLATVSRAPIRFTTFATEHATISAASLRHILEAFYGRQLVPQVVLVAGSLGLLGNPVELCASVGTGVKDLFYEPAQGAMLGPAEAALGVVKGTSSLVRGVVTGAFGSITGIGDGVSRHLAMLGGDREFAAQREAVRNAQVANRGGVLTGIGRGLGMGLGGVVGGVSGIVTQPIRGARAEGVKGFAKGVGKGLMGAVVKPVVGVTDAAVSVMSGISQQVDKLTNLQHLEPRLALPYDPLSDTFEIPSYDLAACVAQFLLEHRRLQATDLAATTLSPRNASFRAKMQQMLATEGEVTEIFFRLLRLGDTALLVTSEHLYFFAHASLAEAAAVLQADAGRSGLTVLYRKFDKTQKCSRVRHEAVRAVEVEGQAQYGVDGIAASGWAGGHGEGKDEIQGEGTLAELRIALREGEDPIFRASRGAVEEAAAYLSMLRSRQSKDDPATSSVSL